MLIATQRQGSVRALPVFNDSIAAMRPVINAYVRTEACLVSDQHHAYRHIAKDFAGHQTVNHGRKEYVNGAIHTNTAESFGAMLERVKQGVFHFMSKKHLSRYLVEIGFRWDHRIPVQKKTKTGKIKTVMILMPFMTILRSMLSRCRGRQVRRTKKNGVISLPQLVISNC